MKTFMSFAGLSIVLALPAFASAQDAVRLREQFPAGYQYHVSTRVELSGTMALPAEKGKPAPKPLAMTGDSAIEYDERVLSPGKAGDVDKTARIYRRMDFQRTVAGQRQQNTLRSAVRRLVILRHNNAEVPFSPDGPLMWNEIDLVRTDVFTPALAGLLPAQEVRVGDRWSASNAAVQELTDLEKIDEGRVECRLEQLTRLESRRHARVAFAGAVRGVNEDGPNRQQLEGYFYFDLESSHLSYLYLKGTSFLLNKDGKEMGRVEGRFVLTRQANQKSKDLTEEALKGVVLEPNADNTQLLYDNPDLGVRFLHPRRWRVAGVRGAQVALDETGGNGLLLTLEPAATVPTGPQFLVESREYMERQKAKILRVHPLQRVQTPAVQALEHFALEADVMGERVVMDYYVLRQARGGATLAARLLPTDLAALQKEVEDIARSVTVTKVIEAKAK